MRYETTLNLNSSELNILLSALQLVEHRDEHLIAKEYGSLPTLYDKLHDQLETISSPNSHIVYGISENANESSF